MLESHHLIRQGHLAVLTDCRVLRASNVATPVAAPRLDLAPASGAELGVRSPGSGTGSARHRSGRGSARAPVIALELLSQAFGLDRDALSRGEAAGMGPADVARQRAAAGGYLRTADKYASQRKGSQECITLHVGRTVDTNIACSPLLSCMTRWFQPAAPSQVLVCRPQRYGCSSCGRWRPVLSYQRAHSASLSPCQTPVRSNSLP
jgi:hypothetical protein